MKARRVIKLKIEGSDKVDAMLGVYLKAINWLSPIVYKTKELNSTRLHKAHYANLREMGVPSQLACSAFRVVTASYKTAKSRKCWRLARFKRPMIPVVFRRDFNRTKKGVTLWGETINIKDPHPLPDKFWKDSKLVRVKNQWYLHLAHEIEIPDERAEGCIVGVDMGVKRMLVASNSANSKPFFYHGGELNHRRSCIRRTRASIRSVGSRSARRLLKRMSGKEAAVTGHLMHVASKALVDYADAQGARRIVMEDLSNVRDASLRKGKDLRSKVHRWPYADMRFKIAYKAEGRGITTETVSPYNTSRACHRCGYVSASNRKGLHFNCLKCGYRDDADLQASKNIRARSVSIACNAPETGSNKPPESSGLMISLCGVGSRLKPPVLYRG